MIQGLSVDWPETCETDIQLVVPAGRVDTSDISTVADSR